MRAECLTAPCHPVDTRRREAAGEGTLRLLGERAHLAEKDAIGATDTSRDQATVGASAHAWQAVTTSRILAAHEAVDWVVASVDAGPGSAGADLTPSQLGQVQFYSTSPDDRGQSGRRRGWAGAAWLDSRSGERFVDRRVLTARGWLQRRSSRLNSSWRMRCSRGNASTRFC